MPPSQSTKVGVFSLVDETHPAAQLLDDAVSRDCSDKNVIAPCSKRVSWDQNGSKRLADADVIPYEYNAEAETIGRYVKELEKLLKDKQENRQALPQVLFRTPQ